MKKQGGLRAVLFFVYGGAIMKQFSVNSTRGKVIRRFFTGYFCDWQA